MMSGRSCWRVDCTGAPAQINAVTDEAPDIHVFAGPMLPDTLDRTTFPGKAASLVGVPT